MHEDETATVRDLKAHQRVVLPLIARFGGRIIDTADDGILAEFPSVVGATECAIEIQTVMAARNQSVPESRRMRFRIGINLGDVVHNDRTTYGDGINIAARLEALADPGGLLVFRTVYEQVHRKLPVGRDGLVEAPSSTARPVRREGACGMGSCQLRQQGPGLSEGGGLETLAEPAAGLAQRCSRFALPLLACEQTHKAGDRAQLEGLGLLCPRDLQSANVGIARHVSRSPCPAPRHPGPPLGRRQLTRARSGLQDDAPRGPAPGRCRVWR